MIALPAVGRASSPQSRTGTDTHYSANGFGCYLCAFDAIGPAPVLVSTMSISHGRTLSPEELEAGETQAG
ncbi:hypothetical protein [Streptomyces cavernae]|uniref:hypothetical protein n=1 Tax=Streptomyces cavernae TaxID=2259034 RepID=UPI000FEBAB3B|nr:hypothetical protein [Streptomyces cavernae]